MTAGCVGSCDASFGQNQTLNIAQCPWQVIQVICPCPLYFPLLVACSLTSDVYCSLSILPFYWVCKAVVMMWLTLTVNKFLKMCSFGAFYVSTVEELFILVITVYSNFIFAIYRFSV